MHKNNALNKPVKKFAGIQVPPDLTRSNFLFLYLNTLLTGILMAVPAIIQPAFLKDIIKVSPDFFGYINAFLQNMSQVATLALVGIVGVISDRAGRKILAVIGFIILVMFFYLFGLSREIASLLHIPSGVSSVICAALCFAPSRAAEFIEFGPGLLVTYVMRLIVGIGVILCYPQFLTMVADYTYEKDRGKGMAFNGIMMGLASLIVFGALAPLARAGGVKGLFLVSSLIALAGMLCTGIFLKDRVPEQKREHMGIKDILRVVNKSRALKASYLCCLITRADVAVLATFIISWAVKVADKYQMTSAVATQKGSIPMIIISIVSFAAFPVIGILLDRWGRVPTIILSLMLGGAGMLLISISPNPFTGLIFLAVVLAGAGMAGAIAGANTLAADASPKNMVGSILGGLNTMSPIGMLFFLQVGGYVFDVLGPGWAFGIKGVASLILGSWLFNIRNQVKTELVKG
jgi:DHA1 family tetracycline resistance protein-like MFS transporter